MNGSEGCPSADQLAEFGNGEVTGERFASIELHLGRCADCRTALAATVMTVAEPMRVPDRYRLLGVLGRGNAGEVCLAEDLRLKRQVAIKYLAPHAVDAMAGARLLHEARILALLAHPHVLAVHDADVFEGRPYVVTALAAGGSLADRLTAGPLPWPEACLRFSEAAAGLHAAHVRGVVHRDFKPANVLLDDRGRAQVADFGLAVQENEPSPWPLLLDAPGSAAGTPAYLAAEVLEGTPATPRSDQFSFTVALYETLFGQRPFPLTSVDAWLTAQKKGCPPLPHRVPRRLAAALRRGLSPTPTDRFEDLDAFRAELEKVLAAPRRRRQAAIATSVLVALGALGWARPSARTLCDESAEAPGIAMIRGHLHGAETALQKASGPRAVAVLAVFRTRAQRLAGDWSAQWEAACRATYDQRVQTAAELARQHDCLSARAGQLQATLEQVALRVDRAPELALDALDAAQPETCRHPEGASFSAWLSRPRDDSIRQELNRLDALHTVQDFEQGEREAARLVEQARARGQKAVEAEATFWMAILGYYRGADPAAVRQAFVRTILLGEEVGDDRLRARALVAWALVEAASSFRYDEAHHFLEQAEAIFRHVDPGNEDFQLWYVRATVLSYERRDQEAEAAFAHTLAMSYAGPDRIQAMRGRARLLLRMGRCRQAQEIYLEAISKAQQLYDASHDLHSTLWADLAVVYAEAGQLQLAQAALARVGDSGVVRKPRNVLTTQVTLRTIAFQLNPDEERLNALRQVGEQLKQVTASELLRAATHGRIADAYLVLGRPREAAAEAAAQLALLTAKLKPEHPDLIRSRCLVGRTLETAGHAGDARRTYQQALEALPPGRPAVQSACAWLGLARLSGAQERTGWIEKVLDATQHSELREVRMLRAEAQALAGNRRAALTTVEGIEGASADHLRKQF